MNYYSRYPAHYLSKTLHLSMLEDGAYNRLLDWCYMNEREIPHEQRYVIARATTKGEKQATDRVLLEFFSRSENGWVNDRVSEEVEKAHVRIDAAKNNGLRGGRPRKQNPEETQWVSNKNPEQTQNKSSPISNLQSKSKEQKQEREQRASASGTRLPPDWQPTPAELEWAKAERPGLDVAVEAAKFADHWHAAPGAKGRKSDWPATWRNWIRRADAPRFTPQARGSPPSKSMQAIQRLREVTNGQQLDSQRIEQRVSKADLPALERTAGG